jgi:hypothetical protein
MASLLIILRHETGKNGLKAEGNGGIDRPVGTVRIRRNALSGNAPGACSARCEVIPDQELVEPI